MFLFYSIVNMCLWWCVSGSLVLCQSLLAEFEAKWISISPMSAPFTLTGWWHGTVWRPWPTWGPQHGPPIRWSPPSVATEGQRCSMHSRVKSLKRIFEIRLWKNVFISYKSNPFNCSSTQLRNNINSVKLQCNKCTQIFIFIQGGPNNNIFFHENYNSKVKVHLCWFINCKGFKVHERYQSVQLNEFLILFHRRIKA